VDASCASAETLGDGSGTPTRTSVDWLLRSFVRRAASLAAIIDGCTEALTPEAPEKVFFTSGPACVHTRTLKNRFRARPIVVISLLSGQPSRERNLAPPSRSWNSIEGDRAKHPRSSFVMQTTQQPLAIAATHRTICCAAYPCSTCEVGAFSVGRRQNAGFVGSHQFIGLAVSDTYAVSAEALIDIGLQNEVAICDPIALKGAPAVCQAVRYSPASDTMSRTSMSPYVSECVTCRGNPPPARAERRRRAT
jgi:hypothetical protein